MHSLATLFRAAQLYTHFAHNTIKGPTFFADHPFLGELYTQYEGFYDDTVERMIGLGEKPDIAKITEQACALSCKAMGDKDADMFFKRITATNKQIQAEIAKDVKGASDGVQNLLQGMADRLEGVDYKIKQRLG